MAQPTLEGVELNPGTGGSTVAVETVGGKAVQVVMPAYSTGDGTANVVAADAPLPVGLAAGSSLVGQVAAGQQTDAIYNGAAALTPKRFAIACGSNGDNTIVAAVGGKKIRLLALFLAASKAATAAVGAYWKSSGGTAISGDVTHVLPLDAKGVYGPAGLSLPFLPLGHFETVAGEGLVLVLDGAQAVTGHGLYVEV